MKKKLKIVVPIILGIFFLFITYELTSQEERDLIIKYIKSAKIEYILAAMFFGAFADIIRGLRWQLLSRSIGYKTNPLISVASVFMCYTSNMAIARSGEFLRASVLSNYNKIPIGKTFGTIAAERVVDIIISFIILITVWALQYQIIVESFFNTNILYFINDNIALIGLFIIIVSLIFIFFLKKSRGIRTFFKSILEGLLSITKLNSNLIFFRMTYILFVFFR